MNRASVSGTLLSIAVLQVLTILVGLARSKGLALVLGPGGFGVVSAIDQAVATAVTFGAFALPYTAMKFMARSHSEGGAAFRRTGSGFLRLLLALGLVTAPLAYGIFARFPALLGSDLAAYNGVLRIAVVGVPPAMLLIFFVNAFAAAGRPAAGAAITLAYLATVSTAAVAGAYISGLTALYIASVASAVVATIAGIVYLNRSLGISVTESHTGIVQSLRAQPEIVGYAACFYANLLGYMLMLLLARTIVFAELGAEAAGRLQAMFSIALALGAVFTALTNLYLAPLLNRRGDPGEKTAVTGEFAARILVLLLLGTLPVLLFPGVFLRMMFRADFVPVAGVLWWFVLWQCLTQIGNAYQQLLIGFDDVVYIAVAAVVSFGTMIAAMALLTRSLGIVGIGVALFGGAVLQFGLLSVRVRLKHGSHVPVGMLVRLSGLAMIVVVSHLLFAGHTEVGLAAVSSRAGFAIGALILAWLTLDRAERSPRALIAALRGGRASPTGP